MPDGAWGRPWLVAVVAAAAVLSAQELIWRAKGFSSTVADDLDLWALARESVYDGGERSVVLLGASRMQLGFDTETFRRACPGYPVVQLSIDGRHPLASLRDLAGDPEFRGIVICELLEEALLPASHDQQQDYVDYYHRQWTLEKRLGRQLRTLLQERLVILNHQLNPRFIIKGLFGRWPKPPFLVTHADRSRSADYDKVSASDLAKFANKWRTGRSREANLDGVLTDEQWRQAVGEVGAWARQIRARGGRVVLLRFPSSGEVYQIEKAHSPRPRFWDVLAGEPGIDAVHFEDVAAMRSLQCPEESHLDYHDAQRCTLALVEELARRGVLQPAAPLGYLWRQTGELSYLAAMVKLLDAAEPTGRADALGRDLADGPVAMGMLREAAVRKVRLPK